MEFKCRGKKERVNSPCLGAFSGGRQLSESPAVAADRADPHAARPNPPGHRNSWKSSSQGRLGVHPRVKSSCSGPFPGAGSPGTGWARHTAPFPTPVLRPLSLFSPARFQVFSPTVACYNWDFFPPPFPPWLLLPVPALRQRGRKCIRWGLPRPVPHPSAEHGACSVWHSGILAAPQSFLLLLLLAFPKLPA